MQRSIIFNFFLGFALAGVLLAQEDNGTMNSTELEGGMDGFNSTDLFGGDFGGNDTLNSTGSFGNETSNSTDSFGFDYESSDNSTGASGTQGCERNAICFSEKECGGEGKCLGAFNGKCNCNACVNYARCDDDSSCGGLKKACISGRCDCVEGFKAAGYAHFTDAFTHLCNVKECSGSNGDDCSGLPCHSGRCTCPAETDDSLVSNVLNNF